MRKLWIIVFHSVRFLTLLNSVAKNQSTVKLRIPVDLGRNWTPIPIPHRTIHEPSGQDLDFIYVAHSHLIHSDWAKLSSLWTGLTTLWVKHIVKDSGPCSLPWVFNWVGIQNPIMPYPRNPFNNPPHSHQKPEIQVCTVHFWGIFLYQVQVTCHRICLKKSCTCTAHVIVHLVFFTCFSRLLFIWSSEMSLIFFFFEWRIMGFFIYWVV